MKYFYSIAILILLLASCKHESKQKDTISEDQLIANAKKIHTNVITLDTHCDINVKNFTDSINYTQDLSSQITLPKMTKGGLDVAI